MNKFVPAAVPALVLLPALALAQSALVGTWKVDLSNVQFPSKPTRELLAHGVYRCETCAPAFSV
jgi:hypothetical protein